jgi:hypothetical protein
MLQKVNGILSFNEQGDGAQRQYPSNIDLHFMAEVQALRLNGVYAIRLISWRVSAMIQLSKTSTLILSLLFTFTQVLRNASFDCTMTDQPGCSDALELLGNGSSRDDFWWYPK